MPVKLTKDEVIKRLSELYKDEEYDYSLVNYINNQTPINIICKYHGTFRAYPNSLLNGRKCPLCSKIGKFKDELSKFIFDANAKHNNKYNYDLVIYKSNKIKVKIICPIHGEFEQTPEKHRAGQGCPQCNINGSEKRLLELHTVIEKMNKVHCNKYDYSLVNYKGSRHKIKIICPIHGEFEQTASLHMAGRGCKLCHYEKINNTYFSKAEKDILEYIKTIYKGKVLTNTWSIIDGELDIYLPDLNLAIEYNGLYWHSEIHKDKNYHVDKLNKCKICGIRLIQIFEDNWIYKQEIVKSRLKNAIGISKRLYARQCTIKEVNKYDEKIFLNTNHISGYINSDTCIGLYYNNTLVSIASFGRCRFKQDKVELYRLCTLNEYTIVGGPSRLLSFYVNNYNVDNIITYADKSWGAGNFYTKIGFRYIGETKPNYFYINRSKRENRFKYRKSELVKHGFPKDKSEHDIMLSRKIYRIYDCGSLKFEYNKQRP